MGHVLRKKNQEYTLFTRLEDIIVTPPKGGSKVSFGASRRYLTDVSCFSDVAYAQANRKINTHISHEPEAEVMKPLLWSI